MVVNRTHGTYTLADSMATLRKTHVNGRAPKGEERKLFVPRVIEAGRANYAGQMWERPTPPQTTRTPNPDLVLRCIHCGSGRSGTIRGHSRDRAF